MPYADTLTVIHHDDTAPRPTVITGVAAAPLQATPELVVLASWDSWRCPVCGDRHDDPDPGHGCGPLQPVTVTVAHRGQRPAGTVLAGYDAHACLTCGRRYRTRHPHGCGPLARITVTITHRTSGEVRHG